MKLIKKYKHIIICISLIIIGIIFIGIGLAGGQQQDVMNKATRVCLECIGIG